MTTQVKGSTKYFTLRCLICDYKTQCCTDENISVKPQFIDYICEICWVKYKFLHCQMRVSN